MVTNPYPPPPWSIGIIELAENAGKILELEQLTGKILSHQELGAIRMPKSKGLCHRSIWKLERSQEMREEKVGKRPVSGRDRRPGEFESPPVAPVLDDGLAGE